MHWTWNREFFSTSNSDNHRNGTSHEKSSPYLKNLILMTESTDFQLVCLHAINDMSSPSTRRPDARQMPTSVLPVEWPKRMLDGCLQICAMELTTITICGSLCCLATLLGMRLLSSRQNKNFSVLQLIANNYIEKLFFTRYKMSGLAAWGIKVQRGWERSPV